MSCGIMKIKKIYDIIIDDNEMKKHGIIFGGHSIWGLICQSKQL